MFKSPKLNAINNPSGSHVSGIELVESTDRSTLGAAELRQEVEPKHVPEASPFTWASRQHPLRCGVKTGAMNSAHWHCSDIYMYVCKNYIYTD